MLLGVPCRNFLVKRHVPNSLTSQGPRQSAAAPRVWSQWRATSTNVTKPGDSHLDILGKTYVKDDWFNAPPTILQSLDRRLHLQSDHPISITRDLIERRFPGYKYYNEFKPIVTTKQNFDSLGFPVDHPGRSKTDTYYINEHTVLRTHTSAHQDEVFRSNESDAWLISADVYRRDAVDRSHYPIFHQMEGARLWDRQQHSGNVTQAVLEDIERLPKHNMIVEDPNATIHAERNPLQPQHTAEEVEAVAMHLKRSIENVVVEIFSRAKAAAAESGDVSAATDTPLRVRWVEAYFPFTTPSWELEIFWQGDWLEVLGCGVVQQQLLKNANVESQIGWAFGIGLERIAMLLFNIPDIRLFWSKDLRFLSQFDAGKPIRRFAPFSKYPECYKDVSFWLKGTSSAGGSLKGTIQDFHENDIMEIVRAVAGDLVEDVRMTDEFSHPKTGRKSMCYRINYRSLERTLRNEEINDLHKLICEELVGKLGAEIR